MAKTVIEGSDKVSASQLKDFFRQIEEGGITGNHIQAMLERKNPFNEAQKQADQISETPYLRLISGGRNPKISACNGGPRASLAYAVKTFPAYLDSDLKNWKLDNVQSPTKEKEAEVWEMHAKDGDFNNIFSSFKTDAKNLKWDSQEQIEKFCIENKSWLRTDGYGTFFLFGEEVDNKKEFFVACVDFDDDGRLELYVDRLSYDVVWCASYQLRFVLPATWRLNS